MNKQHTQLIDRLEETGDEVVDAFEQLSDEQIQRAPKEGEWTLHQAMAHLRDTEVHVFLYRVKLILQNDAPVPVENFDQDEWNKTHYAADEPRDKIVREFRKARRKLVKNLRGTRKKDWARYAIHPLYGNIPIDYIARHAYSHTLEHLAQLRVAEEEAILAKANGKRRTPDDRRPPTNV
ncbi:MAG TPA: DinB family protein [Anaerolineae bacterium]|nr:DinB family protein [Anaerolineae bacterium]